MNAKYTERVMRGAKPISRTFRKDGKAMVQIKRNWFDTALKEYERGETHGRLYYSDIDKLQSSMDEVKKTFGEVLEVWRLQRS